MVAASVVALASIGSAVARIAPAKVKKATIHERNPNNSQQCAA
jgi:hypothetical protein